ncbi:flagellar hook protein FlgE [Chitinimonas lacunae]|uniref:Flagellar hook protein FlgE n=1 Tax=Chitinimonas lacunae TaxID=1963018 RepID=A0ABV8MUF3_9NEIS
MIDSIFVGMAGLSSYSRGLKVISNNVTNMNTPGFKSSQLQFSDLFYQGGGMGGDNSHQFGTGVGTLGTYLNLKSGDYRQTGNSLDLSCGGQGFFVLQDEAGNIRYTRAGQFDFDAQGQLKDRSSGAAVMGMDENGKLQPITLDGLNSSQPKATGDINLNGSLPVGRDHVIDGVSVFDVAGGEHLLKLTFTNTVTGTPSTWKVTISENGNQIGSGEFQFSDGKPVIGKDMVPIAFTGGSQPFSFRLKLSPDVRSAQTPANSAMLAVEKKDGYGLGTLTGKSFDAAGYLVATYSNGQTVKGKRIALARFDSAEALEQLGDGSFIARNSNAVHYGTSNREFGEIKSGTIEVSNVDLSQEFSDLVLMQRGYQASSQLVSTANEMIQQLFDMKGRG